MSRPDDFKPTVYAPGYGLMLVEVSACPVCGHTTVPPLKDHLRVFPAYVGANREAQLARAGWRERSWVRNAGGSYFCAECAKTHASFTCALCKEERKGTPEESYGDPAEYLCTPCYETVPAKTWDAKVRELEEAHRYDFE